MALTLNNKTIELPNGLFLDNAYVRTECSLDPISNIVIAEPQLWISKEAFLNNKESYFLFRHDYFTFPYDRNVDGADLLTFANNKAKEVFESMGFSVEVDL